MTPSPWVTRFGSLVAPGGTVLDLACGAGRHTVWLLERGHRVVAVDRDVSRLAPHPRLSAVPADLEAGAAFPFAEQAFDAIVVTNYLHRPLLAVLVQSVAPGGVLLYETFAAGNERFGRPNRPEFLLRPGELLEAVRGQLRVVAYEDLDITEPRPAAVQRIAAVRAVG